MNNRSRYALRFVGCAAILLAGLGLWYNSCTLFAKFPPDPNTPYFLPAFYVMSAICIACYLALLVIGVQFIRLDTKLLRFFITLMIFEVAYFFAICSVWLAPGFGMSIGAATGVANGGLMFQFMSLFPLWGPLLAGWAKRNFEAGPVDDIALYFASEQIDKPTDWLRAVLEAILLFVVLSMVVGMISAVVNGIPNFVSPLSQAILLFLCAAHIPGSVRRRRKERRQALERRRTTRLQRGLCPRCEYNLTGLKNPCCPECGMELPPSAAEGCE